MGGHEPFPLSPLLPCPWGRNHPPSWHACWLARSRLPCWPTLSLAGLPASRALACRGQPIAHRSNPPSPPVDRQTGAGADWRPQRLRSAREEEKIFLKVPAMLLLTHTPPVSHSPSPTYPTLSSPIPAPATLPTLRGMGDGPACTTMSQAGKGRAGAGLSALSLRTNVKRKRARHLPFILSFCFVAPAS